MIHIAICDDEENFLFLEKKLIQAYMKNHSYQYCINTFSSGMDFLQEINTVSEFDIIFLDINMDQVDGIETAKRIREYGSQAYIVFVTAFITYALEGYKVDAIRYLLKEKDSLEPSMEECLDRIIQKMNYKENKETFFFLEGEKTLCPDDIVYIESNLHKLTFHLTNRKTTSYSMYEKLDVLDQRLCSYGFCRIHKSFLVNLKYVESVERYTVKLKERICHKSHLSISQSRYKKTKEQFIFYQGEV